MPRPVKCRKVCYLPETQEFRPVRENVHPSAIVLSVDEYETIKEMAEEYGIDRQRIYSFRRRGWSLEDAMQMCVNDVRGRGRLFEYNGKLYRSPKALAEEYGLPWNSLAHYIQRCKTVEEAVDRCKEAQEKKIMLWGKKYQSRYEVATAFGIKETSISAKIHTRN